ncbi:MAG: hypothetical protein F6K00_13210 [Leptolyngbya sp. SIOISBB]|nr:hypothetical protein [Leptolyngbya sp. SIOISBB]
MAETYLTIARQGRNAWWCYPLSLGLALGLTVNTMLCLGLPFIIMMAIRGDVLPDEEIWMQEPIHFFGLMIAVNSLMVFGLTLAIANFHRRSWRTVINPQDRIRWPRIFQGWIVWLGVILINIGLLAAFDRDRYTVQFTTGWLWRWGPTLLVMPVAALMPSMVYGYYLQGLGLLIPQPLRLTAVVAVLIGLGQVVSYPTSPTLWDWGFAYVTAGFSVWIILQDQGLELFIGMQAANWLTRLQIVRLPDATPTFPTLLTRHVGDHTGLTFIIWLVGLALFYAVCFYGLPNSTPKPRSTNL